MKIIGIAALGLAIALAAACASPEKVEAEANVVHDIAPRLLDDGEKGFGYAGKIKNVGDAAARFARVVVTVRRASGAEAETRDGYAYKFHLEPGQSESWTARFSGALRGEVALDKTTFEIRWK